MALTDDNVRIKAATAPMKLSTIEIIGCVLLALLIVLFATPIIVMTWCLF